MKNDRTNTSMYVSFTYPGEGGETEETMVYIPFSIYMTSLRKIFDANMVRLDGKDNDIWNLLVDLGFDFDNLEDNDDFIDYCRELYKGSEYEEEDFEDWKDTYEMMHNLGEDVED